MAVPERVGFSPATGKLKSTKSNTKLSFCLNDLCCDIAPSTMTAIVWATSGVSESPLEHGCDVITLTRSSLAGGGWKWTGNANSSVWADCIFEDTFSIEVRCDQAPAHAQDDCDGAMSAFIEGDNADQGGAECCCDYPCMKTLGLGPINASSSPLEMLESGEGEACSPDLWNDGGDVSFFMWVYTVDGNGNICCHPSNCPPTYGACSGNLCDSTPTKCSRCTQDRLRTYDTWRVEGTGYGNACCKWLSNVQRINSGGSGCSWDVTDTTCNTRTDWEIEVDVTIGSSAFTASLTFTKSGETPFVVNFSEDISGLTPINCDSEWQLDFLSTSGDPVSDPCVDTVWDSAIKFVWNPRHSSNTRT